MKISALTLATGLVLFGLTAARAGDVVYVNDKGSETYPYDSVETAFAALSDALSYAAGEPSVKKIHVVGTQTLDAKVELSDIEVFGDGRAETMIRGSGSLSPLVAVGDNVFLHGLNFAHANTQGTAGAVFNMTGDHSVISNCWISGAKTKTVGHHIAGSASAGLITHCLFTGNTSNNGGTTDAAKSIGMGLLGLSGTARMRNSVFAGNGHNGSVRGPCDGVIQMSGSAVMENCVVYGNWNKASAGEGDTTPNYRARRGGGIFFTDGTPTVRNCIVRNNKTAAVPSDGNYPTQTDPKEDIYSPTVEKDFNILGGCPVIENCNTVEGQVPDDAVKCQTDDPKFADPDHATPDKRDFSIAADSPCVDAGAFEEWQVDATDYTGLTPRYQGSGVDIGAYEVVKPTPKVAHISLDGVLAAEKYATVKMSAFVTGLRLAPEATFAWYASDPREGSAEPIATGISAEYRFTAGTWTIYLKVENADGAGLSLYGSSAEAVVVTPGADFYVDAKLGSDDASGDIDAPFKSLTNALERTGNVPRRPRIRIIGRVQHKFDLDQVLENVEIYGSDRTTDALVADSSSKDNSRFNLGANAFIHDLKLTCAERNNGGCVRMVDETAVVSNCWISGNYFTTGGDPAGVFSAGLVTHTLVSGNYNNNSGGTVLKLVGTAKMRNCVFTDNRINGSLRGNLNGVLTVSGSAELENCVVYGNYTQASENGDAAGFTGRYSGGIYVPSGSPTIRNCIVRANTTSAEGEVAAHSVEKNWHVQASATPRISACNTTDAPACATGCQTGDPKFADPDNATASKRDFSIGADSPCVDAGVGKGWRKGATDYTGHPRIQGRRVDIGAYEYNSGVVDWGLQILVR